MSASGRAWPWAIAGVLAATVALNIIVWVVANQPESATVEPDYYRKAVAWDSTRTQEAHDVSLGWKVGVVLAPWGGASAPTPLTVTLADSTGRPLAGATVEVTAIHNALASHPLVFALAPASTPGTYTAAPVLARRGAWEIRLVVRRGGDLFTADLRRETEPHP